MMWDTQVRKGDTLRQVPERAAVNLGLAESGDPGRTRTLSLPLRRRPLYPVELRGRMGRF
jgi:hypothetical protein